MGLHGSNLYVSSEEQIQQYWCIVGQNQQYLMQLLFIIIVLTVTLFALANISSYRCNYKKFGLLFEKYDKVLGENKYGFVSPNILSYFF